MTFRHISETLPGWLVAELEKMAEAVQASAKFNREVEYLHEHRVHTRRSMATARPTSEPHHSAVVIDLRAWKGGRDAPGGGSSAPAVQRDREEERRC